MTSYDIDPAAGVFAMPSVDELVGDQLSELRLGYEDLSDGEATRLLTELPETVVAAIHRFTIDGPTNVIGLVAHIGGLLEGLDGTDPERRSQQALEAAQAEVKRVSALVHAYGDYTKLPFLGRLLDPADPSPDMAKVGWGVIDANDERDDAVTYLPTLDLMAQYLVDPSANRQRYEEAMLTFMNDVIFRPGVSFSRS